MKKLLVLMVAAVLAGCDRPVKRAKVAEVKILSPDGRGYPHSGPIYQVALESKTGEQIFVRSIYKMIVGKDACVQYDVWISDHRIVPCED